MVDERQIYSLDKHVMPGTLDEKEIHIHIKFESKKLSITGDCDGHSGQIDTFLRESLDKIKFHKPGCFPDSWNKAKLKKLLSIWDKYHLNDLNADCEHQRALGWGKKEIRVCTFQLKDEVTKEIDDIKDTASRVLKESGKTSISSRQQKLLNLKFNVTEHNIPKEFKDMYELKSEEQKSTTWVHPEEHPEGVLTKPCPTCGYKFGTKWNHVDVPNHILLWLEKLETFQLDGESSFQHKANTFLKKTGTILKVIYLRTAKYFDDEYPRDIYQITITRGDREFKFEFGNSYNASGRWWKYGNYKRGISMGHGHKNTKPAPWSEWDKNKTFKEPDAYAILASLEKSHPGTFKDFCSEFGYESDSKKAEKVYEAVMDQVANIERLFSTKEIKELSEIN